MGSNAPKPGTGLFGYRRSAVHQIIAEGEDRLQDAEERLRTAESRVAELQAELDALKRRNAQTDQKIQRLQNKRPAMKEER
jgi:predicted DNA-binding protein YlxM (UPF0122 family)